MNGNNVIAYDYQEFHIKQHLASMYSDSLENFGWEIESSSNTAGKMDIVTIKGKRDRKIPNKAELIRLQHQFDAYVSDIQSLEFSKIVKGSAVSFSLGIIGTAFMAGSVFAITSDIVPLCIALAVPGFIGWILPYFCYRNITRKKTMAVTPIINHKYDEAYAVCEKANALISS